jgi:hypothetical protein
MSGWLAVWLVSFENSPLFILSNPSDCESEITVEIHGIKIMLKMDKEKSIRRVIIRFKVK